MTQGIAHMEYRMSSTSLKDTTTHTTLIIIFIVRYEVKLIAVSSNIHSIEFFIYYILTFNVMSKAKPSQMSLKFDKNSCKKCPDMYTLI